MGEGQHTKLEHPDGVLDLDCSALGEAVRGAPTCNPRRRESDERGAGGLRVGAWPATLEQASRGAYVSHGREQTLRVTASPRVADTTGESKAAGLAAVLILVCGWLLMSLLPEPVVMVPAKTETWEFKFDVTDPDAEPTFPCSEIEEVSGVFMDPNCKGRAI